MAVDISDDEPTRTWGPVGDVTVMDAPTVVDDTVYVAFQYGEVRAIDRETGETKWRTYTQSGTHAQTSPVVHEGRI